MYINRYLTIKKKKTIIINRNLQLIKIITILQIYLLLLHHHHHTKALNINKYLNNNLKYILIKLNNLGIMYHLKIMTIIQIISLKALKIMFLIINKFKIEILRLQKIIKIIRGKIFLLIFQKVKILVLNFLIMMLLDI
jgi:hypothetical protein